MVTGVARILIAVMMASVLLVGKGEGLFARLPDYREEIEREFDFAPGGSLSLTNFRGQIEISGWNENRVEICALKTVKGDEDPGKAREWMEMATVEIKKDGNEIEVATKNGDYIPVEVSYWIYVPERTNVMVKSMSSYTMLQDVHGVSSIEVVEGPIFIQRLGGIIDVSLVNGPALLEDVRGSLAAKSVNGTVRARLSGLDSARLCAVNGRITLELPATAAVDLEVCTLFGEVRIDPLLKIEGSSDRRKIEGRLNGGGVLIDVSSVNGKVSIEILDEES